MKDFSVTGEDYRNFLCGLFDVWYNNDQTAASIRLFENILAVYLGVEPEIFAFKNRCGSYAVVEYNGDVYPCDFFVEKEWALGNLLEIPLTELLKKRRRRDFSGRKQQTASACSVCEWNFLCHFGCQHYRSPAGENVFCTSYREFFRYTAQRFKRLKEGIVQSQWERTSR